MKRALGVLLLAASPALGGDLPEVKARGALRVLAVVLNQEDVFMSGQAGGGLRPRGAGGLLRVASPATGARAAGELGRARSRAAGRTGRHHRRPLQRHART